MKKDNDSLLSLLDKLYIGGMPKTEDDDMDATPKVPVTPSAFNADAELPSADYTMPIGLVKKPKPGRLGRRDRY